MKKEVMIAVCLVWIVSFSPSTFALDPVTVQGDRFYSNGEPYYPSSHFLVGDFTHAYFSPVLSDSNRASLIQSVKNEGYNSIDIYTLNQGDYSSKWVTPYMDSGSFVMGGNFDEEKIAWWRGEFEKMIQDDIRPIIWLRADDSPGISSGDEFKRYIDKMVESFDHLPVMWVLALEVDEYWSKSVSDEMGSYLNSKAANPVGQHQLSGRTDYMTSSWVHYCAYQYGGALSWSSIYSDTLSKKQAIGKPFIASEYHMGDGFTAKQMGLAAAFAGAAGSSNGAPFGLDEFMGTLPDNMVSTRNGNILTLQGGGVTATADMTTLQFSITAGGSCGDSNCDAGECNTCFQDCLFSDCCPDGTCNNGETCTSCQTDCGACPSTGICDNLEALYHLDGNANDDSGNSNVGTVSGATLVSSKPGFGQTYSFDGGNDFIDLSNTESLDLTGESTFSAWVKSTRSNSYQHIVGRWDRPSNRQSALYITNSNVGGISIGNGGGSHDVEGDTLVNDGEWHHIAGTYKESTFVRLYVDGVLEEDVAPLQAVGSEPAVPTLIGVSTDEFYFSGTIDDVAIWSRALSLQEISDLYNSGAPISCGAVSSCGPSDTSGDGVVSINELIAFIDEWKTGNVDISGTMQAIGEWKSGC